MKKKIEERRTMTPQIAAERYGLSVGTLANDRYNKHGPRYFRCGRKVLYLVDEFEAWLLRNPVMTIDSLPDEKKKG
jgi:hypothetical protein